MMDKRITAKGISFALLLLLLILGAATPGKAQEIDLRAGVQQQQKAEQFVLDTNDESYNFLEGVRAFTSNNYEEAKGFFKRVIEENPGSDAAYYYLSMIAIVENEPVAGESYIKEAIARDTSNYWYYNTLAKIYIATQRGAEATKLYEEMIRQFPARTDIYFSLANLYLASEDLEKAEETLDKIEKIFGKSDEIALTRFNIFKSRSNWEGAIEYLKEYDNGFDSPRIESLLGDLYSDRFKDSLAMVYYNKALRSEPNYPGALVGIAELYRSKGDFDNYFKSVKPFFANGTVPLQMKGAYLQQLFQASRFVQTYKVQIDTMITDMLACSNPDSTALYLCAAFYAKVGENDKCIKILRSNQEAYPASTMPAIQYLSFIYSTEDWNLTESEAQRIATIFPEEVFPLEIESYSKIRRGAYGESIPLLEKMRDIGLRHNDTTVLANTYSLLGDAYYQLGNHSKTFQNYKKALEIRPDNIVVLNNYAYYLAVNGKQLKRAYEYSAKTVAKEPDNPTYLDTFGWILYLMGRPVEAKSQFKHAMLYGGKESAVILDHYAEVLYTLGEYDLAFIYWDQAKSADNSEKIQGLSEKIEKRKAELKKGKR